MFLKRHPGRTPIAATTGCALIRVDIDVYRLVTRLQDAVELRLR
jgi:hypothetical protein